MKERSEPQFYDVGEAENVLAGLLTVTPLNSQNTFKTSKMFTDAVNACLA